MTKFLTGKIYFGVSDIYHNEIHYTFYKILSRTTNKIRTKLLYTIVIDRQSKKVIEKIESCYKECGIEYAENTIKECDNRIECFYSITGLCDVKATNTNQKGNIFYHGTH